MSQAKTLTQPEIKQVLAMIALDKHAKRNRAMFLLTTLGGLRVGEVAALRYGDVMDENHQVRQEIRFKRTSGTRYPCKTATAPRVVLNK